MATIDLDRIQFWPPPSNLFLHEQYTSSQSQGSTRNQPAPLHNTAGRIFKRNNQSAITTAQCGGDSFIARVQGTTDRNNGSTKYDDELDDDLPSIEEILGLASYQKISTGGHGNAEAALQDLDKPTLNSQGTRDRPVILEDDELDIPDPKATAVSTSVDTSTDFAFELSKPVDPPNHEAWHDFEAGCYINEELLSSFEPEQEGLAASTRVPDHSYSRHHSPRPLHDRIGQDDNNGNSQHIVEEPRPYTLHKGEDNGRESRENISELETDMLLAFEEHEKSSSDTTHSSPCPHDNSTEQFHPRIDQEHDQGGTNYSGLEGLRHSSRLRNREQKELHEQQQQQEVAVDAIREREVEDESDDKEQQGKRREKRRRQDGTEEVSSNSDNSEDPIPIKRRRLSPRSSHPTSKSSRTQRFQQPCTGALINQPTPVKAGLVLAEKELQRPSLLVSDSIDDIEAPRPAKRRRPSSSKSDPSYKAKWQYQRPSRKHSRQGRSHTVSPQTQLHRPWPVNSDGCAQSQHNYVHSKDGEPIPTTAEYQEWPLHGFLKRIIIGNEIRYSMDFSLEQLQGLCAIACHLHDTSPSSSRDSIERMNLPKVRTRAKKAQLAPLSQNKRMPFTSKENAMLADLKENKKWSWKQIEEIFPQRTLNSLQVHYCTKLKGKVLKEGDGGE